MAVLKTFITLAATAMLLIQLSMAANYTVGGTTGGWDTSTNLQSWASSQSFSTGDNLLFQYTATHDVVEVSKSDYDSCQSSSPIQSYNDGNTVITLSSPGKRYFICGTPGHCNQGMKLEVDTLATTSSPPPASPPSSPSTPPPAAASPTSSPSPALTPESAPVMSPSSPSISPSSITLPPSSNVPSTESPTSPTDLSPQSPPSSASETTLTMGFTLGMLMLLAL